MIERYVKTALKEALSLINCLGDYPDDKQQLVDSVADLRVKLREYLDDPTMDEVNGAVDDLTVLMAEIEERTLLVERDQELSLIQFVMTDEFRIMHAHADAIGTFDELWKLLTEHLRSGVNNEYRHYQNFAV